MCVILSWGKHDTKGRSCKGIKNNRFENFYTKTNKKQVTNLEDTRGRLYIMLLMNHTSQYILM